MKSFSGTITEISNENGQLTATFTCSRPIAFTPGQYIQVSLPGSTDYLPINLFPVSVSENGKEFSAHIKRGWLPGSIFQMRGMLGKGFSLSLSARNLLLVNMGGLITTPPLLALINFSKNSDTNITFLTDEPIEGLPNKIEILPLNAFKEIKTWPNTIAVSCELLNLNTLLKLFDQAKMDPKSVPVEVCVKTPLLCAGISACGLCSVLTKSGWKHACKDGPVFKLEDLVEE